ncbi:hypothetical protein RhiJN_12802 [Ceratobasidium sp. AG-Ba]|nr:hypothetical protein RhiJN_12802 [Ceratobasidium sp. AG-Ba]
MDYNDGHAAKKQRRGSLTTETSYLLIAIAQIVRECPEPRQIEMEGGFDIGFPRGSPSPEPLPDLVDSQEVDHMRVPTPSTRSEDLPLDIPDEDDREYQFDQLLDDHERGWYRRGEVADLEPEEHHEAEIDMVNALYDEDFGLLEHDPQDNEAGLEQRFELPMEDDPIEEAEGEPEEGDEGLEQRFESIA